MKKWLACLLVSLVGIAAAGGVIAAMSACAASQTVLPPEQLMIQEVLEIEGKTKDELYVATMEWMVRTFRSAEDVIQFEDKEAGKIVGKGIMAVTYTITPINTRFTLAIDVKDNKVRVTFSDFWMYDIVAGTQLDEPITNQARMNKITPEAKRLISSLGAHLKQGEEEW